MPAFFKADGLEISQHEATSKDGTRVPYFQVSRKGEVVARYAPNTDPDAPALIAAIEAELAKN